MKILAVADEECPALWDYYVPGRLSSYDLILSCGDLKASYLSFLVTMGRARLLYVHGNHDGSYDSSPPEGCEDIDGQLVVYKGIRILGLGGCRKYHEGPYQYTDKEMERRIASLKRALKKTGGVDLVIAHSPPLGIGDGEDPAHIGFEPFRKLIEEYRPQYFLHGHFHLRYEPGRKRIGEYRETKVINVSERFELEIPERGNTQENDLLWITKKRNGFDLW